MKEINKASQSTKSKQAQDFQLPPPFCTPESTRMAHVRAPRSMRMRIMESAHETYQIHPVHHDTDQRNDPWMRRRKTLLRPRRSCHFDVALARMYLTHRDTVVCVYVHSEKIDGKASASSSPPQSCEGGALKYPHPWIWKTMVVRRPRAVFPACRDGLVRFVCLHYVAHHTPITCVTTCIEGWIRE